MKLLLTIVLNAVIVILIGILILVGVMVFRAYSQDEADITQFIEPAYLLSLLNFNNEETFKKYESITYTFDYPASWKPIPRNSQQNTNIEMTDLRIPVIFSLPRLGSTTLIGYFRDPIAKLRPADIVEEQQVIIAGRQGYKWIYKKDSTYYVYYYAVPLSSELIATRQASTFVIMVEAVRRDKDLEEILDKVANSVTFAEK